MEILVNYLFCSLKLWESKLLQSRAIDFMPADANVRMNLTYPLNMSVSRKYELPIQNVVLIIYIEKKEWNTMQ